MKIAVEGCCHGKLDLIYKSLPKGTELLIICGDFQAIRNRADFNTISVPPKYRSFGDFHRYYSGAKLAPLLTIFIGGNHECSSYLKELKYGGWVCPNIYYLGEFGSVFYRGLRISGLSGIYNDTSFKRNVIDDESLPYNNTLKSVYHIKPKNFLKMYLMKYSGADMNVVLSHDWPQYIYNHGDLKSLLHKKSFFKNDIDNGRLGNPLSRILFNNLKSDYWFSSHLHVKFEATVNYIHEPSSLNADAIDLDMDMDDCDIEKSATDNSDTDNSDTDKSTYFLALDKCSSKRQFIQQMTVPVADNNNLSLIYDKRAIAINKIVDNYILNQRSTWESLNFDNFINISNDPVLQPIINQLIHEVNAELTHLDTRNDNDFKIPNNFKQIAPPNTKDFVPLQYWPNNQTIDYCNKFLVPQCTLVTNS